MKKLKRYVALFLAMVLAAAPLGSAIPANAATPERQAVDLKNDGGKYAPTASTVEDTTFQGLNALKITPDGTTESNISIDNWLLKNYKLSSSDYKYVAVDYYYEVEEQTGSWIDWYLGTDTTDKVTDKADSDQKAAQKGPTIEKYDVNKVGDSNPQYMALLHANSYTDIMHGISSDRYEVGKTYVLSCDYYMPAGSSGSLRLRGYSGYLVNAANPLIEQKNIAGGTSGTKGTVSIEYTVVAGEAWLQPDLVQHVGDGYYWNVRFAEKGSTKNLMDDADFAKEGGSWIGWKIDGEVNTKADSDARAKSGEIIAYDKAIGGDSNPKYMAKLPGNYTNSEGTAYTYLDVYQSLTAKTEIGKTYVFTCDYYMPEGSTGNIRFRGGAGNPDFGNMCEQTVLQPGRGTATVEYTLQSGDTWRGVSMVQYPGGEGYYWNPRVTEKGSDTNLLDNPDFTAGDVDNQPDNMVLRFLDDTGNNSGIYKTSNAIVANQWARMIFDVSDLNAYYDNGIYKHIQFFPYGSTKNCKGNTASGTMYINNVSFYKADPGALSPSVALTKKGATISTTDETMKMGFDFTEAAEAITLRNETVQKYGAVLCAGTKDLTTMKAEADKFLDSTAGNENADYVWTSNESTTLPELYTVKITNSNSDGVPDEVFADGSKPAYMAKLPGDYSDSTTGKPIQYLDVHQSLSGYQAGETYVFTCDYYMPEDSKGSIRFRGASSKNGTVAEKVLSAGSNGTASVTYTVQAGDTWFGPAMVQYPGGDGYYWNLRVTKQGSTENLLQNADFTEAGGSWTGWKIGDTYVDDKAESDSLTKAKGPAVVAPYDNRGKRITAIAYIVTDKGVYYSDETINHSVMSVVKAIFNETYLLDDANVVNGKPVTDSPLEKALAEAASTYDVLTTTLAAAPTNSAQRELLLKVHFALNKYVFVPEWNFAERFNPQSGGADAESATLRESIMNASNGLGTTGGTVYYISSLNGNDSNAGTSTASAWKTLSAYSNKRNTLKSGDTVLFERGGVYRGTIKLVSGVSYGAYGNGPKPAIYGSEKNYANANWSRTDQENVWVCSSVPVSDVGTIVFDHGRAAGDRILTGITDLAANFEFYQDLSTNKVYLYLEQNPSEVFYDIEFCVWGDVLRGEANTSGVTIDNLSVKYGGSHGIAFADCASNITITNCELGWIGGSLQYANNTVRYGNAIEFWDACSDIRVENNWIYQIYDAGITHQGGDVGGYVQSNITYRSNLVEYCSYGFEYFTGNPEKDLWKNILYEKNIVRFSGYGWGVVRPDPAMVSLICGWGHTAPFNAQNFVIRDNIFDVSANYLFVQHYDTDVQVTFTGNTYYQKEGKVAKWIKDEELAATNQETLEAAVSKIDSAPKLVQFLE